MALAGAPQQTRLEAEMQNPALERFLIRAGVLSAILLILYVLGLLRMSPAVVH
jgi:hypothetical protein